ncbi:hypothetical protein ACJRPK_09610 [Aquimarina sp. 2-A2]|uniref:hypothetical protein n=1 Tax=Aquimarina sp. 2-A2 TaxID=3382644 RepID=UPI00387F248D
MQGPFFLKISLWKRGHDAQRINDGKGAPSKIVFNRRSYQFRILSSNHLPEITPIHYNGLGKSDAFGVINGYS